MCIRPAEPKYSSVMVNYWIVVSTIMVVKIQLILSAAWNQSANVNFSVEPRCEYRSSPADQTIVCSLASKNNSNLSKDNFHLNNSHECRFNVVSAFLEESLPNTLRKNLTRNHRNSCNFYAICQKCPFTQRNWKQAHIWHLRDKDFSMHVTIQSGPNTTSINLTKTFNKAQIYRPTASLQLVNKTATGCVFRLPAADFPDSFRYQLRIHTKRDEIKFRQLRPTMSTDDIILYHNKDKRSSAGFVFFHLPYRPTDETIAVQYRLNASELWSAPLETLCTHENLAFNVGIAIAIIVGVLVVILLLICVIVYKINKRRHREYKKNNRIPREDETNNQDCEAVALNNPSNPDDGNDIRINSFPPISMQNGSVNPTHTSNSSLEANTKIQVDLNQDQGSRSGSETENLYPNLARDTTPSPRTSQTLSGRSGRSSGGGTRSHSSVSHVDWTEPQMNSTRSNPVFFEKVFLSASISNTRCVDNWTTNDQQHGNHFEQTSTAELQPQLSDQLQFPLKARRRVQTAGEIKYTKPTLKN